MPSIWRVENSKGKGCYSSGDNGSINIYEFLDSFLIRHANSNGHPSPEYDHGINRGMRPWEICGFISLEQAHNWFSQEELKWLKERGFSLKRVDVAQITAIGTKQVLAIRTTKEEAQELEFSLP